MSTRSRIAKVSVNAQALLARFVGGKVNCALATEMMEEARETSHHRVQPTVVCGSEKERSVVAVESRRVDAKKREVPGSAKPSITKGV